MTIRSKVIGSFLIVSLFFVAVSYLNYERSRLANQQLTLINELYLPLSRLIVQMQGHVHGLAEDSKRLQSVSGEHPDKGTFSRMVRDLYPYLIFRKIASAEVLLKDKTGDIDGKRVSSELGALETLFERATQASALSDLEPIYQEARNRLQELSRIVDEQCQKVTGAAQRDATANLKWSALFSAVLMLLGVLTLAVTSRALRPLPDLIESIKHNASGDFLKTLKISPNNQNEFGVLAREYNKMLLALADRDSQIQSQQRELVQSERLATVGKLSAEIVHEIRNPLNAISLNIDWIASEIKSLDPEVTKALESLSREVARLNEITERYLMQARVPERTESTIDVNDLLTELVDFLSEEHRGRKIAVNCQMALGAVRVNADRARLRQALLNILKNSRESMPNGGVITIRTAVKSNVCEVFIEDAGCGMSNATLQSVFRPFFSTKANGNGLGLMLTRSMVEEAHGSFSIKSQMGVGTQCFLQFPASFA
ncbi:MAG: hypothetical protein HYR96_11820 [Deltaproteobacteria bacterium]|nr:hypothetical protein [Deltaproteobacteria bacterium]MBI3293710.1 hypothetical protein [Deltaproteobacteria bacterium]